MAILEIKKYPDPILRKKAEEVEIEALNEENQAVKIKTEGLPGRIFQHEIDHLNGILFLDKISFWQKLKLKRKLKTYYEPRPR